MMVQKVYYWDDTAPNLSACSPRRSNAGRTGAVTMLGLLRIRPEPKLLRRWRAGPADIRVAAGGVPSRGNRYVHCEQSGAATVHNGM